VAVMVKAPNRFRVRGSLTLILSRHFSQRQTYPTIFVGYFSTPAHRWDQDDFIPVF
jgi:hypothetical protein